MPYHSEYEAWKAWLAAAASQCRLTHAYPDYDTCRVSEKMRKIRDKHEVHRRKEKGILAVTKLYLQKIKLLTSTKMLLSKIRTIQCY